MMCVMAYNMIYYLLDSVWNLFWKLRNRDNYDRNLFGCGDKDTISFFSLSHIIFKSIFVFTKKKVHKRCPRVMRNQWGSLNDSLEVPIRSITRFETKKIPDIFSESIQDICVLFHIRFTDSTYFSTYKWIGLIF